MFGCSYLASSGTIHGVNQGSEVFPLLMEDVQILVFLLFLLDQEDCGGVFIPMGAGIHVDDVNIEDTQAALLLE